MSNLSSLELFKLSLQSKSDQDLDNLEKTTQRRMLATPTGTKTREKAVDTFIAVLDEISNRS